MNHIYKSIFNKALGVFTAVPEFASAHGKGSERTVVGRVAKGTAGFAASALAISVGLALTSTNAVAGPGIYINDGPDEGCLVVPDAPTGLYGITSDNISPPNTMLKPGNLMPDRTIFGLDKMSPCQTSGNGVHAFDTQTNRTLFYGKTHRVDTTNNGSKNLTLGGRLDVNSGIIGVGDRGTNGAGATNSIRMGTGTTLADANKKLNSISIGVDTGASDANAIAIGANTSAAGSNSSAIGLNAKATTDSSIAIGTSSEAGGPATSAALLGTKAIAIGYETKALGTSNVALGYGSVAENGHDSIAIGIKAKTSNLKSISIGAYSEASGAQSTVISNNYGSATGAVSTASGTRSQVYGAETNVSGDNSVAIGDTNTVASARTYALGNNINVAAGADDSLVFGTKAGVGGANAIALGNTAKATQDNSIAQGTESATYGKQSVSIGYKAVSGLTAPTATQTNAFSVSIGNETEALDASTIAIGDKAKAKGGVDALAVGTQANAMTYKALAIGAYSQATGRQSTVIGNDIQGQPSIASGTRSQILGVQSNVSGDNSVSIGDTNTIASARTYALGNNINAAAGTDDSLAFGSKAKVEALANIAMGKTATTHTYNSIAIGSGAESGGKGANDAFDGVSAIAIGPETKALGTSAIAIGQNASVKDGHDAIAMGVYSKTANNKAITIGAYSEASGLQSTVIGSNFNQGVNVSASVASGTRSQVYGVETKVSGNNSVAIGDTNTVASARTYALGNNINVAAGADDALAFGTRAAVGAENTVAIGANANAAQANSVALGAGSATSAAQTTGPYTLNGYTAAGLPNAANGTVSVGAAGKERQIQNVAAGVISATSTDAINGSQLYATNNYLSNLAVGVKNVLGGDAAVDNAGNLTMSNIGGTGKGNVNDAIAAANTKVAAGENITVTPTTNADGSKTYTVATKKDLVVDSVKAGDTTVNTDGVTIAGGPSVKKDGINAGDKKITGVADGNVAAGSKDAVNGGQLAEVKAKADSAVQDVVSSNPTALTANKVGNTVTLTPNFIAGDLVNADGTVNAPATADEGKLVSAKTVADALKANHFVVDTKANGGTVDAASEENAKVGSGNKVTFEAGKNLVAQQTNTANGGATVNYKLSDTLENLVSVKSAEIEAGIGPNKVVLNNNGVKVGDSTLNDKGLTINNGPSVTDAGINAGNKKITGVANGDVSTGSTDAVNGGQLAEVKAKADSAVQDVKSGDENALTAVKDPNTNIVTVTPKLSGDLVDTNGNITAPATPADKGKLVTAGTVAEALANTHFVVDTKATDGELDAASQADQKIKASNKVTLQAGKNLKAKQTNGANGAEVEFSLKDSISLTQVTAGDSTLNTDGLTIAGGPSVKKDGIDAGDKKITNVAPGAVTPTSKDAVNGSQLYNVADNVKDLIGPDATIDPATGKVTVADPTQGIAGTGKGTIGEAIKSVKDKADTAVQDIKSGDEKALSVTKAGNTYTITPNLSGDLVDADGNITAPATDADKGKLVTAGTVAQALANTHFVVDTKATDGELDAASEADQKVKAGNKVTLQAGKNLKAKQTNGANGAQVEFSLKDSINLTQVTAGEGDNQVVLGNDGVKVGGNTYINKDGLNANNKVISNVADGVNPNDAVNKGQLDAVGKEAAKHTTVKAGKNVEVTEGTNAAGGKEYTVKTADNLDVTSVKAGDTTVNNDGLTIAGGPSVTKAGINAGGNKITNVAAGVNDTDAVNKGQLDKVAQNVVNVLGGNATVNGNGDITMSNIGDTGKGNVNDAIKAVNDLAKKAAAEKTSVKAKDGRSNVTVTEGVNAAGGHEYTVDVERAVTEAGSDQVTVTSKHDADSNTTTYTVDVSDKTKASLAKADSAVQGLTSKDGNLNFNKDPNGNVEVSFNDNLNVKNVTTDRVQVANGPSMSKDGINAAGKAISNVANGNVAADSKDAVNGGQLHETAKSVADVIGGGATVKDGKVVAGQNGIGNTGQNTVHGAIAAINQNTANNFNQIRGDLRKMDRDLRGGIAGALATAGLPQAFRPGKSMVAAAASTYRGQSGLAIGVSRISDNGKVILKVTGNTNSRGDFGGTIGAGYQW